MKQTKFTRIMSSLLAAAMLFTLCVPGVSAAAVKPAEEPAAQAAEGLLPDPGFETKELGPDPHPTVGHWNKYNYTRQKDVKRTGEWAVKSNPKVESTISMKVADLIPGTTYELSAYVRGSQADKAGADPRLGVKGFGGAETNTPVAFNDTDWTRNAVQFTYTNPAMNPEIYIWTDYNNSNLALYVDDMDMTAAKGISAYTMENGKIVVHVAGHTGTLTAEEFTASYSAAGRDPLPLALTAESATADSIVLTFDAIPGAAEKQDVTVTLSYGAQAKQQVSGSFEVAADSSQVVTAEMVSVEVTNGTAVVALDKVPNPLPSSQDFTVTYTENGGAAKTAAVASARFDEASKTVTVKFAPVEGSLETAKKVVVSITYNEKTLAGKPFDLEKLTARTFYVAANGSDDNDGLSEAKPFKTLDKLNTITFIPGDRILLKKGDTFKGALKPKGSGAEGAPIVIASYGEGNTKPVIQAEGTWTGEIQKAGGGGHTPVEPATYKGAVWLENVEYYEVRDLELVDLDYQPDNHRVNDITIYSAGVRVVNKNMGDLHHYVFDNLTIHGFRGPGTNFGKSGGGIQFNVLVDSRYPEDPNKNVPSAMHDITVTNCEIYECGRSGINFLNPWGKRIGEKWPGSQEGVLPWHAFTNFYMANNIIHHIDGDALITDTTANAVIEKNLCYETAIHLGYMGAAVGFFNWNSDDNYFQYNEVFNVGKNATKQNGHDEPFFITPGDAQGIEIDALNDRSWVQYNYVHDNYGGFMMWCNVSPFYPSYDGIVRYNISENDHMNKHGIFDVFPDMYGSETYNNVFYMNPETALTERNQLKFFHHANAKKDEHKVFNNIFYLTGDTAYPVETWGNTAINWQSNIFYNIEGAPAGSNMTITADDPLFVDPGKGYDEVNKPITAFRGLAQMRKDLEGYKLVDTSVAIDAGQRCPSMDKGVPIGMTGKTIPMHDFFGKTVTGIPDIGVHETDVVSLKVTSSRYDVDQKNSVITVPDTTNAPNLLESLSYSDKLEVAVLRGTAAPDDVSYLLAGDVLHVAVKGGKETRDYTIRVTKQTADGQIPVDQLTAIAGNEEKNQGRDLAANVLKDDGSVWHTDWNGSSRDQHWIYLKINDGAPEYKVTGISFLPRQDGSINGVVTSYQIMGSSDGESWTKITEGTWNLNDRARKTITLTNPEHQNFRFYKLVVLDAGSDQSAKFASMQEMRLLGHELATETAPAAPTAAKAENITKTTAQISWTVPADTTGIVAFEVQDAQGKTLARVSAETAKVTLTGLTAGTSYNGLKVIAENAFGAVSEAAAVPAFTTESVVAPTAEPTAKPTAQPTAKPTAQPTAVPTAAPTAVPTAVPVAPTTAPVPPQGGATATGDATGLMGWMLLAAAMSSGAVLVMSKMRKSN